MVMRRVAGALALAAVLACLATGWRALLPDPVSSAAEARLLDLRFAARGPVAPPEDLLVVAIDEQSVETLGWTPPPRWAIAEAITRLRAAGATFVAIDLLLLESSAAGPLLAAAIAPGDDVLLAVALRNRGRDAAAPALGPEQAAALERSAFALTLGGPSAPPPRPPLLLPAGEVIGGAALAHVNVGRAGDRVVRQAPLAIPAGSGRYLPGMPVEAARRLSGLARTALILRPGQSLSFGGREIPTGPAGFVVINHYGPAGTLPTVGLVDLLEDRVPAAEIRGRGVFLGASAESLSDSFATPLGADVPGVEVLASLAGNIAEGSLIRRDASAWALTGILAGLSAALTLLAARLPGRPAVFAGLALVWAGAGAALYGGFALGLLWLDAVAVFAALTAASIAGVAGRLGAERRARAEMARERENLARYVSPRLAGLLAEGDEAGFSRDEMDVAILFVDVAGFTTLFEGRPTAEAAAFIRRLHTLYEESAHQSGGVIVSYEGDGALMAFGLPEAGPRDALDSVRTAEALIAAAKGFPAPEGMAFALSLRVTAHHGPVSFRVMGGRRHAQITVIGDTVNVTSRMQEMAKGLGEVLLISGECLDAAEAAAPGTAARYRFVGEHAVRGRATPLALHAPALDDSGGASP